MGRRGQEEYAEAFENQTAQAIQSLRNRLEEAMNTNDLVEEDHEFTVTASN